MTKLFESDVEEFVIELLQNQDFEYLSPEQQENERESLSTVIFRDRLKQAINQINPKVPAPAREQAFKQVFNLSSQSLMVNNEAFHLMLTEGIEVEYMGKKGIKGDKVSLIDFENIENNEFLVCNQFTVIENNINKRPDVVVFINGLPLVVIELKNPADENATVQKAFTQLQNYKKAIPSLFHYNSILIASDGLDAKTGTISSDISRFVAWKSKDGFTEDKETVPQIETMVRGMLSKETLIDLIRHFIVFEKSKKEDLETGLTSVVAIKKIAAYHQYYAVNKAIQSTLIASGTDGNRKAGVVWHTQGSGKSLSMVFYTGKTVFKLNNPTVVVLTDRNDLDDQLFDTFASCKQLLRQEPVQAESRESLKNLLKVAGGGIVFTTIQKFFPESGASDYEQLSERKNIIVIADEAHRSQYGFGAKTRIVKKNGKDEEAVTRYGFAKYMRDALPNASFIGFTGTPIEKEDASTPAVFGNYVDVYDIAQAVEDGATVKIFYESRLAKVHLKPEERAKLDEEAESIGEGEETAKEKAKAKWAQIEAIVGHSDRLKTVAADIIDHFEKRQQVFEGKGMIVCMSRRIAVELYEQIIELRPEWENDDLKKGCIKVVMTSASSDPEKWQKHSTTKKDRKAIADRFKDTADPLKLVIVRDMWLTGFDVPCLHTMYVDKPMRGHNLMQAIARVNRVFKDKPGGLIVDYIGIASDLKSALATYTASGGKGTPTLDQEEAVATLLEKFEIVEQMFDGFDYKGFFTSSTQEKLILILEAQEHILGLEDGKNRFTKQVSLLSQAFALSVPHPKAMEIKDEVGFFQTVKARLVKFEPTGSGKSDAEVETAIRQIVDKAVVSDGIIDVFDAAGIKKPDISILSDDFMEEVRHMERKNLALELLKKILNDEIKTRTRKNLIQSKKLSEMLENAINKYQNNLLTTAQVIEELIKLAKEFKESDKRGKDLNLNDEELAFYDALANNESAKQVLGDKQLAVIAIEVFNSIKRNATIDWTLKETVRARLRRDVKRILKRYGYPPDMQLLATENVLKQAELMADGLMAA
ncbi:type I restriction endonuclease subunit R [Syntrophus aciditrophicus]|uniref:Type I restriction enzyme endonuclease subunit n=1 Tax=Syntrophus aciditrophicus (strain SB) TaxID=56780 RepID=Q2LV05_SYNAS|nr:type I restriction endonuclease subunit R [Syntrophus aciditrophicus]ABC77918.1 type I restriction-modification system restriction subunit [Syntrophus aciditrophicus SB]